MWYYRSIHVMAGLVDLGRALGARINVISRAFHI